MVPVCLSDWPAVDGGRCSSRTLWRWAATRRSSETSRRTPSATSRPPPTPQVRAYKPANGAAAIGATAAAAEYSLQGYGQVQLTKTAAFGSLYDTSRADCGRAL